MKNLKIAVAQFEPKDWGSASFRNQAHLVGGKKYSGRQSIKSDHHSIVY
jgi:hypothetical protein